MGPAQHPGLVLGEQDGSDLAEQLVTEGMRLSPPEPSFLDMRNAILAAANGIDPDLRDLLWGVFAGRGMGFYAAVADASDTTPLEDFNTPPAEDAPTGTVSGTVTSADTGLPLSGVPVGFGGLTTPTRRSRLPRHRQRDDGTYTLNAPTGRYGSLNFVGTAGFDLVSVPDFVVRAGEPATKDAALRRDWAASKGGAEVVKDDTKYDNTGGPFGCGLDQLIDQSARRRQLGVQPGQRGPGQPAPRPADGTDRAAGGRRHHSFGLDPSNTCGDDRAAATKDYRIETSADGVNFDVAKRAPSPSTTCTSSTSSRRTGTRRASVRPADDAVPAEHRARRLRRRLHRLLGDRGLRRPAERAAHRRLTATPGPSTPGRR